MTETYTTLPAFIMSALAEVSAAGMVPSVRAGAGGNSHSVWFIKFTVRQQVEGRYDKLHDFVVKVTSSYSQQFLEFTPYSGPAECFDGLSTWRSMGECIRAALKSVEVVD